MELGGIKVTGVQLGEALYEDWGLTQALWDGILGLGFDAMSQVRDKGSHRAHKGVSQGSRGGGI